MFDGTYLNWNHKRIKGIIDFYGHKFFYFKKILDLGGGYGDIGGVLYRLGADITVLDARQEHLKIVSKKFPGIKTIKADLDRPWQFGNKHFDMIIDLGMLCHLKDYEEHLKCICNSATHLILETAVCDSDDPHKCISIPENKDIYDLSVNGLGCRPTSSAIERIIKNHGMNFKRQDNAKYNCDNYIYDWSPKNNNECDFNKRRMWFAVKHNSPIQFATSNNIISVPNNIISSPPVQSLELPTINNDITNTYVGDRKFVIVIPSYNNQSWCERNIISVINQNYDKYRVIFTDDASSDNTFHQVNHIVNSSNKTSKFTLLKNSIRKGALANLYNMIHTCDDDEIILTLDGDDWFPHENVLSTLNNIYSKNDIWMTYGQYKNYPDNGTGIAQPYPSNIIANTSFRQYSWHASHLRTFYSWLFKKIKKEDLFYQGQFMSMTWDLAMMFPMLEMSGSHSKYVSDILYIYNLENPINDHKIDKSLQQNLDRYVRKLPKYQVCQKPVFKAPKIGLLLIATGKYHQFVQGLISSADKYFLQNLGNNITYYVFSDTTIQINSNRKIVQLPIEHRSFPFASMDRFKHFCNYSTNFAQEDYLYYVDVDSLFVDNITPEEIIGDLVGVQHCGYINQTGPYENNSKSSLYVNQHNHHKKYKNYFGGGFSGGRKDKYLELSQWCKTMIDLDVSNGVIPIWHDETALNRYFLDHEPTTILSPSYHYPQSNIEHYKNIWLPQVFQPKILLLDKNHNEMRNA